MYKSYEWFGHSVSSREGYLMVGAPESRICAQPDCDTSKDDVQSVGRAYLYKYPSKTPLSVVRGDIEYEQLGYSCDLSDQSGRLVAAISSPSKDTRLNTQASFELNRGGVVQLFELLNGKTLNLTATLKSDRPYSGFGSKIKVSLHIIKSCFLWTITLSIIKYSSTVHSVQITKICILVPI